MTEFANWIAGRPVPARSGLALDKFDPATGEPMARFPDSDATDIQDAVAAALRAQPAWAATPAVQRGRALREVAEAMRAERRRIAEMVHHETGKSLKDALGETDGACDLAHFYAGEGQRLFGRTMTSGSPGRYPSTWRRPVGVAGLIIAANTPVANVAWKIFPAMICGNAAILKASEDAPGTASLVAEIAHGAGLPPGVLNVVHGTGIGAGRPLVAHPEVGVVSFTGSSAVGKEIAGVCAQRLAKVSLELGGKNPFVVCDDADLYLAVQWALLSAFSNAGQRCASGSRIIVCAGVYEAFRERFVEKARALKVGTADTDDLGPVINARQLSNMESAVKGAAGRGAKVLCGGARLNRPGYFMAPTVIEGLNAADDLSTCELFGPIANLYSVDGYEEALALANASPYGLTACIHTRSLDRAMDFSMRVRAGMAVVNGGTFGSEPHMPFGGMGLSGNGTREPGTEAIDIYTDLKNVVLNVGAPV